MASKDKDDKVPTLKGKPAEDKVLAYIRRMNRPFGAADVSANLKNAVTKTATQKILLTLAEKGEISQKAYGKTTIFVAKQDDLEEMPKETVDELASQVKTAQEENKTLALETKALEKELTKIRESPTNDALAAKITEVQSEIESTLAALAPLRAGVPLISEEQVRHLDSEWTKCRTLWVQRRKVYKDIFCTFTDSLPRPESDAIIEDLGLEMDSEEHAALEKNESLFGGGGKFVAGKKSL